MTSHNHDYEAANASHFDRLSEKFELLPSTNELARYNSKAILGMYPFDDEHTDVMDFACGIGMVSQRLASHCRSIIGVDVSQGMVTAFNKRVDNQGIPPEEMHAVCTRLRGTDDELEGRRFDVVVCAMSYHHFSSTVETTRVLACFLKPGGALIVTDLLKDSNIDASARGWAKEHECAYGHNHGTSHDHTTGTLDHSHAIEPKDISVTDTSGSVRPNESPTVKTFDHFVPHIGGFIEEDVRAAFEGAGLRGFLLKSIAKGKAHGLPAQLFVAKGTKPQA
ncbi:hypothetical protein HGRIS_013746 [Hohenbuehelia grisea]|uniref:Methyltransferase domain-containing protein n=1 Tax=Hohenbuehelia grisea TaxID=104357 RepID=A0ABR3IWB7_9AGAR